MQERLPESCQIEVYAPCKIRGWKEGRDIAAALASLPVHWLSLLPVAQGQLLSGCCLYGSSGTGTTGQHPLGSPGLVAAFNALWREDFLPPLRICSWVSAKVPILRFHPVDSRVWRKVAGLLVSREGRKDSEFLVFVCPSQFQCKEEINSHSLCWLGPSRQCHTYHLVIKKKLTIKPRKHMEES